MTENLVPGFPFALYDGLENKERTNSASLTVFFSFVHLDVALIYDTDCHT